MYSSALTGSNEKFPGTQKYYEAIQITVNTTGYYTLKSLENIDGYGYLYRSYFNPSNPSYNLLAQDDQNGGNNQFSIQYYLEAGVTYILVFTTYQAGVTGSFSIVVNGPDVVELERITSFQITTTTTDSE